VGVSEYNRGEGVMVVVVVVEMEGKER